MIFIRVYKSRCLQTRHLLRGLDKTLIGLVSRDRGRHSVKYSEARGALGTAARNGSDAVGAGHFNAAPEELVDALLCDATQRD